MLFDILRQTDIKICRIWKISRRKATNLRKLLYLCTQIKIKNNDMTTRREKAKAQKPQLNKQLEAVNAEEPKVKDSGTWKENLGKYLIDISKYVVTGVIIASTFNDMYDRYVLYIISAILAFVTLVVGLVLTNKKKGN